MARTGGIESTIQPGVIARAIAGVKFVVTGQGDWFGPGQPLGPSAPEVIDGRQWDLPVSVNTINSTKTEGLSFHQLRNFADSCDLVRLLIETRKDQVCGLSWTIRVKDDEKKPIPAFGATTKVDPRIKEVTSFLRKPDTVHSFSEWLRMVLEDMFVLDATSLYVQRTRGQGIYALRPIDGSTIKRIIDTHGWTPMYPAPAYQQILKGTVALDYTSQELIYKPRNPRTNRLYGYSPVEQVIVTAKILLDRQASNLEYYQTGNLPEGWIAGAAGWTPEQLLQFQKILDSQLSGNLAQRRKARVVPNGATWTAVKEPALKGDYDEWLARIACFAFSYPPTPFIKQMNRSTSDNAKQSADEEGVQPITKWVKELLDEIIQEFLGYDDLEFGFDDKEAQDPLQRAQIDQIYVNSGVLTKDEVRADMGRAPLPEPVEAEPMIPTTEQVVDENGVVQPVVPGVPAAAGAKVPTAKPAAAKTPAAAPAPAAAPVKKAAGGDLNKIDRKRDIRTTAQVKLADEMQAALELAAEDATAQVTTAIDAGVTELGAQALVDQLSFEGLAEAGSTLQQTLQAVAKDGTDEALTQLNLGGYDMTAVVHQQAVDWADRRAASLITSNGYGGDLVDATRDLIRGTVEQAIKEGWSNQKLAKELENSYAFSKQRAMTIAQTETAFADAHGNMLTYIASGVVKRKKWLLDAEACPICKANAAQGEIPLLQAFVSGDMTAPAHPNCECDIAPIVD
jgi:SPP1 gp7 family putative phage head morphogenesis protein